MATRRTSRAFLSDQEIAAAQEALRELLEKHGRQTVVADLLGFTQQSISAALRQNNPQIGPALARAIEDHIGRPLISPHPPSDRFVELDPRYPNLAATIEWLRGQMPDDFLDDFAKTALKSDGDLSREDWYFAAKSAYARWRGKAVPPRPLPDDDDDPIAASMAAARKKHAKKKGN